MTRKVLVALILIAGLVGGVAWWYRQRNRPSAPDAPATSRASRRDFSITVEATGEVKPQIGAEVRVGARISGKVVRLHANLRDRVEKGRSSPNWSRRSFRQRSTNVAPSCSLPGRTSNRSLSCLLARQRGRRRK